MTVGTVRSEHPSTFRQSILVQRLEAYWGHLEKIANYLQFPHEIHIRFIPLHCVLFLVFMGYPNCANLLRCSWYVCDYSCSIGGESNRIAQINRGWSLIAPGHQLFFSQCYNGVKRRRIMNHHSPQMAFSHLFSMQAWALGSNAQDQRREAAQCIQQASLAPTAES